MGDKVNIKYEYENAKKREEDEKKDLRVFLILSGIILLMFPLSILIAWLLLRQLGISILDVVKELFGKL